jgi:hypothetical protein
MTASNTLWYAGTLGHTREIRWLLGGQSGLAALCAVCHSFGACSKAQMTARITLWYAGTLGHTREIRCVVYVH